MQLPIYLDYNATGPMAPEVIAAMVSALESTWGNASSNHRYGHRAQEAMQAARRQVASLLGADPEEILFTSGGTESDNAAILGVAAAAARKQEGRHLVISNVEHAAVERACQRLEADGYTVTRVPVGRDGRVDAEAIEHAIRPETVLISVMHGQNETGVIQPVDAIGKIARRRGIPFHCDAAQSVGKLALDVDSLGVDLLTVAGHKFYGPKGVGALYLRKGTPFESMLLGAGHEAGRRAGTENVPGIVGLGAAAELARTEFPERTRHLEALRDRLRQRLTDGIPDLVVHGESAPRLPNTLSVALPGVQALDLVPRVPDVAIGHGAACHSGKAHVSPTLRAMGIEDSLALSTLRLCVGRPTTDEEIDRAGALISKAAAELRTGSLS